MRFGVAALPEGRRRDWLHPSIEERIVPLFRGRVLPFDAVASKAYASLRAKAGATGNALASANGFIAATAAANGLIVAARDVAPFEAARLRVIDPWASRRGAGRSRIVRVENEKRAVQGGASCALRPCAALEPNRSRDRTGATPDAGQSIP